MRHSVFFAALVVLCAMVAAQGSTNFPLVADNALFVPNWFAMVAVGLALAAAIRSGRAHV